MCPDAPECFGDDISRIQYNPDSERPTEAGRRMNVLVTEPETMAMPFTGVVIMIVAVIVPVMGVVMPLCVIGGMVCVVMRAGVMGF